MSKADIKKGIDKRFDENPFAHKYKGTLAARRLGRDADKIEESIHSALKRKRALAQKVK